MQLYVLCIRDAKANSFNAPIFVVHIGSALRDFQDEVNRADKDNKIYMHPEDFELFKLGVFDTQDATFVLEHRPVSLMTASACKQVLQS